MTDPRTRAEHGRPGLERLQYQRVRTGLKKDGHVRRTPKPASRGSCWQNLGNLRWEFSPQLGAGEARLVEGSGMRPGQVDDELRETWPSDAGEKGNLNVPPAATHPTLLWETVRSGPLTLIPQRLDSSEPAPRPSLTAPSATGAETFLRMPAGTGRSLAPGRSGRLGWYLGGRQVRTLSPRLRSEGNPEGHIFPWHRDPWLARPCLSPQDMKCGEGF